MAIGQPLNRAALDGRLADLARITRQWDEVVAALAAWNIDHSQATLEAAEPDGYGYTDAEAYAVKATLDRWEAVRQFTRGGALPTEQHDLMRDTGAWAP